MRKVIIPTIIWQDFINKNLFALDAQMDEVKEVEADSEKLKVTHLEIDLSWGLT